MTSATLPRLGRGAAVSAVCGIWAAAIALVPDPWGKAVLAAPGLVVALTAWSAAHRLRWVRLFLLSAILLPPLPMLAWGDSGPHPALLPAAIGVLLSVVWLREWSVPATPLTSALAVLLFALACSIAPAAVYSGGAAALATAARVMLFALTPLVFLYTAYGPAGAAGVDAPREAAGLFWAAVAAALFGCVDFYYQLPAPAGFGAQFVWLDSGVFRRAQGLFYEASTLGNFCVFFLVMIAVALLRPLPSFPVKRAGLLVGAAALTGALMLSYSRGSLVCLLVALIVLGWMNRSRVPSFRIAAAALGGLPVIGWLIWRLFPGFAEMYWIRLSASGRYLLSATDGVLSGRVSSWTVLLDWLAEHPWQLVLGIGYKTLPYTDYLGSPVVADNMYLSLLLETGLAGIVALIWLNLAVLSAARSASRSPDSVRSFLGTWMFCFWAGETVQMASGDLLTYWRVLPVYFYVLALAVRR